VILIDANILIYAHVTSFAQHKLARDWLDRQLNASVPVGLPWASVLGFLRLVTNPRVFERPESIGDAWQQVRAWFAFARCDAWITKDALALTDMHSMIRTLKDVRKMGKQDGGRAVMNRFIWRPPMLQVSGSTYPLNICAE
jgi:toxin-antitoxin system PIN domain toxin